MDATKNRQGQEKKAEKSKMKWKNKVEVKQKEENYRCGR